MSACIIPVAPNFQDPPSVPDSPPYVSSVMPTYGEVASFPATSTFQVVVTDLNLNATIFYRWVVDYPPFVAGVTWFNPDLDGTTRPRLDGTTIRETLTWDLTCKMVNFVSGTHQVELIVADGPFRNSMGLSADVELDTTVDPMRHVVPIAWTVNMSCPAGTTSSTP